MKDEENQEIEKKSVLEDGEVSSLVLGLEKDNLEKKTLRNVTYILFAVAILLSLWQSFDFISDDSPRSYACPSNGPYLDSPMKLTNIEDVNQLEFQQYLLGFLRKFVRAQHPRNVSELEPYYSYILKNSEGWVRSEYNARLERSKEDIAKNLESKIYTSLYPKSHFDYKIRQTEENKWVIQFEAVEVRRASGNQFARNYLTAKYFIRLKKKSIDSSEVGLKVYSYEMSSTVDSISGKTRNLR